MNFQRLLCCSICMTLTCLPVAQGQPVPGKKGVALQPNYGDTTFPQVPSYLKQETRPIDLASALQLAGVQNPEILLASERVVLATALRQLAAAQFLPTLNAGSNVDTHNGALQQANGTIINTNRDALYLGLGANAVAAGTVGIPGVNWVGNPANTIYQALASRQGLQAREFANQAVRNNTLLRVAGGYMELLRAEGRRAIAAQNRTDALEIARITGNYAKTGQGRQADAERAATELEQRGTDQLQAENEVQNASARLCNLLSLDPAIRLHPVDSFVVPHPLVPEPIPVPELLVIAITQRPELKERQAAIRAALYQLQNAKVLPFSPNVITGYSAGAFGGGSNILTTGLAQPNGSILQQPRFTDLGDRQDVDVVLYWTARNLGLGNLAMIRIEQSNVRQSEYQKMEVLNKVRTDVVLAHAKTHARFAQIESFERAVQSSKTAFQQDYTRIKNREGLPLEVLDSMRLLGRSRYAYLNVIVDYNRAHFDLYVALGQPPADTLARPVPIMPAPTAPTEARPQKK